MADLANASSTGEDTQVAVDPDEGVNYNKLPLPTTPLGRLQRRAWVLLDDPSSSPQVSMALRSLRAPRSMPLAAPDAPVRYTPPRSAHHELAADPLSPPR